MALWFSCPQLSGMWTTVGKVALAWVPFYVLWTLFVLSYGEATVGGALAGSAITITNAAALGGLVWYATGRFPWPDPVRLPFYGLHGVLAGAYSVAWFMAGVAISWIRGIEPVNLRFWEWENIGWRFLMGVWLYGLVAGVSYALRIRQRLREKERAAARLEALATRARLDSLWARLNPHFLFNALNSLGALIGTKPDRAEEMVERLAGLLRYSL
ncbi:MAG: histidine kinase, partial [Gemmatimonadota bacterium]|nr:histidine kinase [Gemmatimonadota bacterium]